MRGIKRGCSLDSDGVIPYRSLFKDAAGPAAVWHREALGSVGGVEVAGFEEGGEGGFVGGLHVGFHRGDAAVLHAGEEALVHRDHAVGTAAFDDRTDVADLTAANGVWQRFVLNEDFMHGAATFGNAFAEELGNDAGEATGQHDAHLVLLVGGKGVDDAVDGLRCVVGVKRAEDEHAHAGAAEGEFDGFEFAHLAEEEDVRVVAHGTFERVGEGAGVFADLAVDDGALFVLVNKPFNALPIALILCLAEGIVALESDLGPASVFLQMCAMQCAYYSLGLWNSVSAIDLTFGAVFTKNFDMKVAPVVLLIYCWSGPILVALILRKKRKADFSVELTFLRSILDCTACAFAYHHRFHPWIFDFFSPKILFQVFWALFFLLLLPLIQLLI